MRILSGEDKKEALHFINKAVDVAYNSSCYRSLCGSVLVNNKKIIGSGHNSPPKNACLDYCLKDDLPDDFKSDKTCCLHAEQRAIMDALEHNADKISGSRIYFIRLDTTTQEKLFAEDPYCTICSKFALDAGVSEFVLYRKEGICVWDTDEYNKASFAFRK